MMNDLLPSSAREPRASPAAERDNRPRGFNKPERPRTLQQSVGGHGKRQDAGTCAVEKRTVANALTARLKAMGLRILKIPVRADKKAFLLSANLRHRRTNKDSRG